jgi:hypothetical protein
MADIRKDFEAKIIAKAQSDEGFRKRLLSDPNGAIRSLGYQLADTTEWKVMEETGSKLFLVLPRKDQQVQQGGKLGDDALAGVAGGAGHGSAPRFTPGCPGCGTN